MPSTTFDRVVQLLNEAALTDDAKLKVNNLLQVQELIIYKERSLLDNFMDEVLAFQSDRNNEVRKTVVNFIEEACKHDADLLPKALERLAYLLEDDSVNVMKRLVTCMMTIYRLSLSWAARTKGQNQNALATFFKAFSFKEKILKMLHGPHDGVRMLVLKFMEMLIIIQSRRHPESDIPKSREGDISLDQIPEAAVVQLRVDKLEKEGYRLLEEMVKYLGQDNISGVNLQTVMGALANIARQRPQFMSKALQGFETIHVNLPPNLSASQVSSVRKTLKNNLLQVLKHPSSYEHEQTITTLLTDLGATQSEVLKAMPKIDDMTRKRKLEAASSAREADADDAIAGTSEKRMRSFSMEDVEATPFISLGESSSTRLAHKGGVTGDIEGMADDLGPKLTVANVTDLVLLSMVMLPDDMPPAFLSTYTPIAAAGTDAQIKHLGRLLGAQLVAAGLTGSSRGGLGRDGGDEEGTKKDDDDDDAENYLHTPHHISTLVGNFPPGMMDSEGFKMPMPISIPMSMPPPTMPGQYGLMSGVHQALLQAGQMQQHLLQSQQREKRLARPFSLEGVTVPLSNESKRELAKTAYLRVLHASNIGSHSGVLQARARVLTSFAAIFGMELYGLLADYCMEDVKGRLPLISEVVDQEYMRWQGVQTESGSPLATSYDSVLTQFLTRLAHANVKETYFRRLLVEAPKITAPVLNVLKWYCSQEPTAAFGVRALGELIETRQQQREDMMTLLLDLTGYEVLAVRVAALEEAKRFYAMPGTEFRVRIEKHATRRLKKLIGVAPTPSIFPFGTTVVPLEWTDDICRPSMHLLLGLMPDNHLLIHKLAKVYVKVVPTVKRVVLKMLDQPVKAMGMESEEILKLIEGCPKGAETLVTRVIHNLTDKAHPTSALVAQVKKLYNTRLSDVRFFIPILKGLTKHEVISALPKLIQLNARVVKEVFNRLLGSTEDTPEMEGPGPISPEELLVALHLLEFSKDDANRPIVDMKAILSATQLCFAERRAFTQEKLSIVISQLMEQPTLPTLFMRTVMQSLAMYPRLTGYVVNVLVNLIKKQVWKNAALWEGFVRCCVKISPQSYQVLLQLPPDRLERVFDKEHKLRLQMRKYVDNFSSAQRSQISRSIMAVLDTPRPTELARSESTVSEAGDSATRGEEVAATVMEMASGSVTLVTKAPPAPPPTQAAVAPKVVPTGPTKEKLDEEKRKNREKLKQIKETERSKLNFIPPQMAAKAAAAVAASSLPASNSPDNPDTSSDKPGEEPMEEGRPENEPPISDETSETPGDVELDRSNTAI